MSPVKIPLLTEIITPVSHRFIAMTAIGATMVPYVTELLRDKIRGFYTDVYCVAFGVAFVSPLSAHNSRG